MGKDNTEPVIASDKTHTGADTGAVTGGALGKMQADAGFQDKVTTGQVKSDNVPYAAGDLAAAAGGVGAVGELLATYHSPTDRERSDAEQSLEAGVSKLIPEADRNSMKDMTTAITSGDSKAFVEAVKKAGGDPEKLKALVGDVNKELEEKHGTTRLDVTGDGKVFVSDTGKSTALAFDPKTGSIEAKSVEHNPDGSMLVKPGETLHVDTDKTFKDIGDRAVNSVNGMSDSPNFRILDDGTAEGHHHEIHIPPLFPSPRDGGDRKWHDTDAEPFIPGPIESGKDHNGKPLMPPPGPGDKLDSLEKWRQYEKDHGYKPIEM